MDLIESRKSVRKYSEQHISDDVLKQILNAGRLAPSWMNVQSWHFVVVKNQVTKEMLSKLACGQPHVKSADAVILCIADKNAWSKEEFGAVMKAKGLADTAIENIMTIPAYYPPLLGEDVTLLRTVEQLTYAMSYMTLEAEKHGVGCCVIGAMGNEVTGLLQEEYSQIKKELNLNDGHCIFAMLTLGYPQTNEETPKLRKDFDKVVSLEKFGEKFV